MADERAARRVQREAEKGDAWAQNKYGEYRGCGFGVRQSQTEAVRYFRLAAAQGNEDAMVNLGICYEHGAGVPRVTTNIQQDILLFHNNND